MSNDPTTPEDAIRKDRKQTDKAIDRKDGLVDDNMCNDPRTPKNAIRKDDKETDKVTDWWYKVVDDNINDDPRFPKDTIIKDNWNVNSAERAGHNAKDLNKERHIMRKWDPKSMFKQNSEKSDQGSCNDHNHINAEQIRCLVTTEKESSERDHRDGQETIVSAANDSEKFEKGNTRKEKAMDNPTDPIEIATIKL